VPPVLGEAGNLYSPSDLYDRGVSDPIFTVSAHLPTSAQQAVSARLKQAREQNVSERLRAGDASLWGAPGTPEIANRLGWLTIAERMLKDVGELTRFADEVRDEGFRDVVLLGMGGSSLAPEVLRQSFAPQPGRPRLHVLDSTDADTVSAIERAVELPHTLFVVSSKSGGTVEPLSMFAHFWALVGDGAQFVAITDPGSGLEKLAHEHGFRHVFAGDPNIGGRYSALSAFGMVPAALMGIDVRALLEGTHGAAPTEVEWDGAQHPAGVWLGATLSALAQAGHDKLTFLVSESLAGLGLWLEQLIAESTGKHGTGILPIAEEPLGEPSVYGEDRVFAYLPDLYAPNDGLERGVQALIEAGFPVITIPTGGPVDLGRVFLLAELAVAVAGWGLQINPFDQPNVQQAKDATNKVLSGYEANGELPTVADADEQALRALLTAGPPHYVAIMGYLQPSEEFDAAMAELRATIRAAGRASIGKATTTFGYGPRFLHSTGQFHKGGPKVGRFLQLLHDGPEDVAIPGAPYSFTTLKNAQAIGDLNTLREVGLPAERVRLEGVDPAGALRSLTAKIKELL
jgi:transaldolase/glucose-6-phosphate isomerase